MTICVEVKETKKEREYLQLQNNYEFQNIYNNRKNTITISLFHCMSSRKMTLC